MNRQIAKLNFKVIKLLNLKYMNEIPIFIGDTNIKHMKNKHLEDYKNYGKDISNIIKNPNQNSIEYIKEYKKNNDFILVAVRVTSNGKLFARTLFKMTERKKNLYIEKGYAKKYL